MTSIDFGPQKQPASLRQLKAQHKRNMLENGGFMKARDLTGQRFGKLVVIKRVFRKSKPVSWLCRCDCGNEVVKTSHNLITVPPKKNPASCGCSFKSYNFIDLTGKTFSDLEVIELSEEKTKTRGALWVCRCKLCDKIVKLPSNGLTSGNNKSCGCKKSDKKNNGYWYKDMPLSLMNQWKQNAIYKDLLFDLTPEYLYDIFEKQNKKCALSGVDICFPSESDPTKHKATSSASLDRIDSGLGYIKGNVQWVHKRINIMKGNLSNFDFTTYCHLVIQNQNFQSRFDWDTYFLNLAFNVAHRSEDPDIHHGAIIVDHDNRIMGCGYNGLPAGFTMWDLNVDPNDRDTKRKFMIHAETNAILNSYIPEPENVRMYLTGEPCNDCLITIINKRIKHLIVADRTGSTTENEETRKIKQKLVEHSGIKIKRVPLYLLYLDFNNVYKGMKTIRMNNENILEEDFR